MENENFEKAFEMIDGLQHLDEFANWVKQKSGVRRIEYLYPDDIHSSSIRGKAKPLAVALFDGDRKVIIASDVSKVTVDEAQGKLKRISDFFKVFGKELNCRLIALGELYFVHGFAKELEAVLIVPNVCWTDLKKKESYDLAKACFSTTYCEWESGYGYGDYQEGKYFSIPMVIVLEFKE